MKEISQIIATYQRYKEQQKKIALATVVKVDGSAYRRPGARMLVSEDGELTGAISGGCLEGDALRKAQSVIFQQKSMIVTYDTTDEDDQKFGIGLGCNGIIQVLIEPIDYLDEYNPVELLKTASKDRKHKILVTVFSLLQSRAEQIGTKLLFSGGNYIGNKNNIPQNILNQILKNSSYISDIQYNKIFEYEEHFLFLESIKPPLRLLLFGAGNDTVPLAKMASLLGWELNLYDGRSSHATKERFPSANKISVGSAAEICHEIPYDENTVALLMTHNFEYEIEVLKHIKGLNLPYIGILGPKKKKLKMIERLESEGIKIQDDNIYGPSGLDLGAEGSEEIALSILSEVKAVLSRKNAGFLRDKQGPIHDA
ncbi:XdhC family protein [Arthrospiribacter ruber]|uniref:XdhC/CoxI family protein n=1 Tax=Arthrospiribacter ruber TaxID=2487934 RepID=A0A951MAK3_9BACT|nr:XdhC/CoxI family protein [Arthrospiribacter ruber]MBW3468041.1 XdhC/CoxI family protein [Arthrospiribacter ruber]